MKTKIGLPLGLALVMFIGIFTTMLALGALNPQPVAAITTVTVTLASTDGGTYTGNVDIDATTAVTFSELDSNSVSNTLTISLPLIFDVSKEDAIEDESKWTLGGTAPSSVELTVGAAGVGGADDTPHTIVLTAGSGMTDITVAPPAVGTIPVDYRPDANIGLKLAIEGATGVTISVEVSTEPDLPGTSAEFDIDPAPAVDGGFSVNVGYPLPGEVSSYSFTVTAEEEFGADDTLTITFPVGTGLGAMSVGTADNWTLGGSVPQTVTVTASERMVELTAPSSNFGTITTGNDIVVEALESAGIVNPPAGTGLTFSVTTNEAPNAGESLGFSIVHDPTVDGVRAIQDPTDPGANAQYQISFTTAYGLMANVDTIRFNFDSSIGAPTSVAKGSVIISASNVTIGTANVGGQAINLAFDPIYRPVPGGEGRDYYTIRVPDMDPREEYVGNIDAGATVTVTFLPSAGLTNATEKGGDDIQVSTTKQQTETNKAVETGSVVDTPLMLTIDDAGDNRNKPLTVTGKGFRNNTTAIVYLDKNGNNMRDDVDVDLVSVLVGSDDTFQATFQVTVPPFEQGKGDASDDTLNKINAVDGEAPTPNHFTDGPVFEVEGLISVTPKSVAVGDKLQISLVDWPNGSHSGYDPSEIDPTKPGYVADPTLETARLLIGGLHHKLPNIAISNNSADFEVEVANDVPEGTPQIEFITTDVGSGAESDDTTITIAGADVTATPVMVVPHQTVTVVGLGFGDRAKINTGDSGDTSEVKFGGDPLYLTSGSDNFNNGSGVTTDSGGNWNASVVVPITGASATPGTHLLFIKDSSGRTGSAAITIAERRLTLEPALARPGETVRITGSGFPATTSRPAEQTTPPVTIDYGEDTVATLTPDSSGNISATFRVPLGSSIPSTNTVKASYTIPGSTNQIIETTIHEVPGATISLSASEGEPGDSVTVTGEGFKAFQSISRLDIGGVDVIPSPKPSTNNLGAFTASILVPDLDLGTHSIEAQFGEEGSASGATVASAIFNLVEAATEPMMPGMMMNEAMAPAMAFAPVVAEDNLVKVFHFDPATQNEAPNYGWTIYDARPLFMATNTLDTVTPGGYYFLQVTSDQMGVEIGGMTMDLYAPLTPVRW